ncbi:DUF2591 domain-containing protein [Salmonella enterica subsp. enterica]|nr:DUF2591 domain-containing protein [Salmonella enterica subsp. enterica serovar Newport]EBW5250537.1 hypothetical protein [Salmonella enterica subsp. enterica serovar Newport]MIV34767.1 DUF2591 domain-containing protein [Salmonella enterica subsp. enterica serovar Newport]
MKVKTSELSGKALDWAVAWSVCPESFKDNVSEKTGLPYWADGWLSNGSPSTDWRRGGLLIENHIPTLQRDVDGYSEPEMPWYAECGVFWDIGETPLIASCRALVQAKLGDEVEIPDELMEVRGV